jgi:energy-coupling factor transport system permease protein
MRLRLIVTAEKSLYQPGQTLLHRFDPRLKVVFCLLLVVLAFSATGFRSFLVVFVPLAIAVRVVPALFASVWRIFWMLRWLLLFTLLLHLFLSPGRTLWGLGWLSFDGLIRGALVCSQILLAVASAVLLSVTTSTEDLALTFGWFVRPLSWLGCRTREWQRTLLLAMDFLPVVHEELQASTSSGTDQHQATTSEDSTGLWSRTMRRLHGLVLRLLDRGDMVAHRMAEEGVVTGLATELPPLFPMALHDQLFTLGATFIVICYWLFG